MDPDGERILDSATFLQQSADANAELGPEGSDEFITIVGCVLTTYTRIASAITGNNIPLEDANKAALKLYDKPNLLSPKSGAALINALVGDKWSVGYIGSIGQRSVLVYAKIISEFEAEDADYFITARIQTTSADGTQTYEHTLNINSDSIFINEDGQMDIRFNDTSGVRDSLYDDGRKNVILRLDFFIVDEN